MGKEHVGLAEEPPSASGALEFTPEQHVCVHLSWLKYCQTNLCKLTKQSDSHTRSRHSSCRVLLNQDVAVRAPWCSLYIFSTSEIQEYAI
jgi:hypothetical protein